MRPTSPRNLRVRGRVGGDSRCWRRSPASCRGSRSCPAATAGSSRPATGSRPPTAGAAAPAGRSASPPGFHCLATAMSGRLPSAQPAASPCSIGQLRRGERSARWPARPAGGSTACAPTCAATPGSSFSRNSSNCSVVIEVNEKCLMYFLMKASNFARPDGLLEQGHEQEALLVRNQRVELVGVLAGAASVFRQVNGEPGPNAQRVVAARCGRSPPTGPAPRRRTASRGCAARPTP